MARYETKSSEPYHLTDDQWRQARDRALKTMEKSTTTAEERAGKVAVPRVGVPPAVRPSLATGGQPSTYSGNQPGTSAPVLPPELRPPAQKLSALDRSAVDKKNGGVSVNSKMAVNVKAPAGTKVAYNGDKLLKATSTERSTPIQEAGAASTSQAA